MLDITDPARLWRAGFRAFRALVPYALVPRVLLSAPAADTGARADSSPAQQMMPPSPPSARALAVIAALRNLLLAVAATPLGTRAVVNLEYLALALLARVVSRGMLVALLAVLLLIDVLFSFGPVFNFGPGEIVAAVEQVRHFTGRAILGAAAVVLAIGTAAFGIVRLALSRRSASSPPGHAGPRPAPGAAPCRAFAAVTATLLVLDVVNGTSALWWRPRTLLPST